MNKNKQQSFGAGTIIRCNRCDRKSMAGRVVMAIRENDAAWRIQDMLTAECGHMDAHWVYDADNLIAGTQ